jgi:hypothetical protein
MDNDGGQEHKHEVGKPWASSELAREAGVTNSYVCRLARQGELQGAFKLGNAWAIPDRTARRWLEERR